MVIIGCGNRLRGDDAAGLLAAERLCALGFPARACSGESSELMAAWAGADDVIVIDAVLTGAPAGTVQVWDGGRTPVFETSAGSTHGLGLAEAIELARVLGRLPVKLQIYGIEAGTLAVGSAVSPEVERGVEEVVRQIASRVKA